MFLANRAVIGIKAINPTPIPIKVVFTSNPKITFNVTKIATPMATVTP
jgi:hypothetical protein